MEMVRFESPLGVLTLAIREQRLCAVEFPDSWPRTRARLARRFGDVDLREVRHVAGVTDHVRAYFDGDLQALDRIAVEPAGTPFQQRVWSKLRRIPVGRTTSYGDIARAVAAPNAVRAVGAANGANPIPIVVPCHRVIGADGSLTGYGGGLERKRWLLAHEGVRVGEA